MANEACMSALAGSAAFSKVPNAEREILARYGGFRRFRRGSMLFQTGDAPTTLHFLLDGSSELMRPCGKGDCAILLIAKGEFAAPLAGLVATAHTLCARSLESTETIAFEAAELRRARPLLPGFAAALKAAAAERMETLEEQLVELKQRNASQRLAAFLLRYAGSGAELACPKRSLASLIGVSPETLSRSLQIVAGHGIMLRGNRIIVRDRPSVEAFCTGGRRVVIGDAVSQSG